MIGINFEAVLRPIKASAEQGTEAVNACCSVPPLPEHSQDLRTNKFVL